MIRRVKISFVRKYFKRKGVDLKVIEYKSRRLPLEFRGEISLIIYKQQKSKDISYSVMISKKLFIFVCLAVALVYAHGASHTVEVSSTLYKQLKNYIETNFSSKYTQVAISVFIVSFPSIPVFFGLSLLGRTLKKKGDKHNFSAKLLNILLSFSCGTLLGDLMLHILPYLYGIHLYQYPPTFIDYIKELGIHMNSIRMNMTSIIILMTILINQLSLS